VLQLNANGAVIGRARRSDDDDRGWSSAPRRPLDRLDVDRPSTTTYVASVATLRRIPSVGEHREIVSNDFASRGYFGLKPETAMTSAVRAPSDAFHREHRQRRSTSDLASPLDRKSSDRHRDAGTWRQPEVVYADDGTAGRRPRPQSVVDMRRRTEHQRLAARDAGREDDDDVPRHRRPANHCHEEPHRRQQTDSSDGEGDHITTNVDVTRLIIDVERPVAVRVPQTELKTPKTERTPVGEQNIVDEGRKMTKVDSSSIVQSISTSLADHRVSSSRAANCYAAPRRAAADKSAADVVTMTNQIWWPCPASSDEEELNDDDASSDSDDCPDDDDDAIAAADDDDDDDDETAKVMSWTEIDASFEESIRELDTFLLQQDSDPL